jgi:HK97 family phage portal protein
MMSDVERALSVLRETIPSVQKDAPASNGTNSPTGKWEPDYWQTLTDLMGIGKLTGKVSFSEAIRISAVLACLDVLSQDVAKCPMRLMERLPNGGKRVVEPDEHWLAELFATEPNSKHTWFEFVQMLVLHLGLMQNAFIAKRMTTSGRVLELIPIVPGRVSIEVNEDETGFVYWVSTTTVADRVMMRGFDYVLLEDEIIHLRTRMFDGLYGYSTLNAGADAMVLADSVSDYQTRLYKNDAQTRGVFQAKGGLNDEAWKRLKSQLATRWDKFQKSGVPIVLEEGVEFQGVSQTADQAQVAQARTAAIVDVARLFRMPPNKIMQLEAVKYENLEAMEKSYAADTIVPLLLPIEQKLERGLLTRRERSRYSIEFDQTALILTDIEKQAKMVDTLMKHGSMELDEARRIFGMNPLPGDAGKVRIVGSTFSLIDESNEVILAAGAGSQGENEKATAATPGASKAANVVRLR